MSAVQGKRIVYLFRKLSDAAKNAATVMAFVTDNTRSLSKDTETTATKDGEINTPGTLEHTIDCTAILATDDTMAQDMEDAVADGELLEIWEVNLDDPASSGKYNGKYMQGYATEWELASNAEDHAEYSTSFAINGAGVRGEVTVSEEQAEAAAYAFKDTSATGA